MGLKETVNTAKVKWMDGSGPNHDIVISSRIRIARNLVQMPFPHLLSTADAEAVFHAVRLALNKASLKDNCGEMDVVLLSELSDVERNILMEKHLISPILLQDYEKKAVVINNQETLSIMLNEEDHLRIQCLLPGLQLNQAWEIANSLDDELEETLDYAFLEQFGYLTACPTNLGTGLRASVMLHLPGLTLTNKIRSVISAISQFGLTVRGMYGEGTEAFGNLYQISNQVTLGLSEEEIISNLVSIIKQVIEQERAARQVLYQEKKYNVEDTIYRAYGTLKHARMLTSTEAMKLLSEVRLGVDLQLINNIPVQILNELILISRPAYLLQQSKKELNAQERDILRAETVRKKLEQY